MLDSEHDIKELDQRTLGIASTTVLSPLALSCTFIVENTIWQASYHHVFAAGEKRSDAVVENFWIAFLIHPV